MKRVKSSLRGGFANHNHARESNTNILLKVNDKRIIAKKANKNNLFKGLSYGNQ